MTSSTSVETFSFADEHTVIRARRLPWDTEVLQQACARIDSIWVADENSILNCENILETVLTQMDKAGIDLVDVRLPANSSILIEMAERHGFKQVDRLNIFLSKKTKAKAEKKSNLAGCNIVLKRPDKNQMSQIFKFALSSFAHSRMYQDPNVSKDAADHFYTMLLETTIQNQEQIPVLAINTVDEVVGFCSGGRSDNGGVLWMIAVNSDYAGKGVAADMLHTFLSHMHQTFEVVEIGTQVTNDEANALYRKLQLEVAPQLVTLHRWRKDVKKTHSKDDIALEYNQASLHPKEFEKVKWGSHEKMMNRFRRAIEELGFENANSWLDVGSGTGAFQTLVRQSYPNISMTGVDVSKELVEFAKNRNQNMNAQFIVSDFLEFSEGKYDLITSIGVLQKTNITLGAFFSHAWQLLKLGGKLMIDTKNIGWDRFNDAGYVPEKELTWFSQKELVEAAEKVGFTVLKFKGLHPDTNIEVEPNESHTVFMVCEKRK